MRFKVLLGLAYLLAAPAAFGACHHGSAQAGKVTIKALGGSSFEIISPGGVRVVTDFAGLTPLAPMPDIVTMNHDDKRHYTQSPDRRIPHVLHGWAEDGKTPSIDLTVKDMHVTNVATPFEVERGQPDAFGSSIFVFETAGICIAQIGHLTDILHDEEETRVGDVDVLLLPISQENTDFLQNAAAVVEQFQPRVLIPIEYASRNRLDMFLKMEAGTYKVEEKNTRSLTVSRDRLPDDTTVIVLKSAK